MKNLLLLCLLLKTVIPVFAQNRTVFEIARNGNLTEMERLYIENPSVTESINDSKSNALILAAYLGNHDVALFLCDKTKNIDYNSGRGTALMAAVMKADLEVVKKLLSLHANTDLVDADGKTALMYAVFFNKNEIAIALIKAGANKQLLDNDQKSALDYAQFNKNTQLIILLDQ